MGNAGDKLAGADWLMLEAQLIQRRGAGEVGRSGETPVGGRLAALTLSSLVNRNREIVSEQN